MKVHACMAAAPALDGPRRRYARLANAVVELVALEEPPARFAAGADAVQTFETKAQTPFVVRRSSFVVVFLVLSS
jgi:hypothetical protein